MNAINFNALDPTPYPSGTYVVLHHGILPPDGLVLSQIRVVGGWPNAVVAAARGEGSPSAWLKVVEELAFSNDRPEFNMGIYQVNGCNHPTAVYGPLEGWTTPPSQQELFRNRIHLVPDHLQHLVHLF